ncbi:hypothetical protein ONE63_005078 [Megalurothrips usitatus]|uniref:Integrase catalytic domain-containing protein n=1 Tax=Megalurothrips usitatus TaxID=439358 RepID=A0AAV7XWU9_9NEOP|nr:hypothetical protein ONE63_005078 [Megalurothrips usitatus]
MSFLVLRSTCQRVQADHLLRKEGYSNTEQEPCIYTKTSGIAVTIVALYVDDFYLFYKEERVKIELIEALRRFIVLKDLGEARNSLGMRIERDWAKGTLKLHQEEYTNSILKEFGMENCEGRPVPLEHKMKLWDFEMGYEGDFKYQKLIGSLLYLSTNTRPDISYAVSFLKSLGTYKVDLEVRVQQHSALKADVNSEPWHERLGHLGKNNLRLISSLVDGMSKVNSIDHKCDTCRRAKTVKKSFPKRGSRRASELLEIVHSDVCEVTDGPSIRGFRYFVTFIDDLTRYTYIGLLKSKDSVFDKFQQYKALVERHTGGKIKNLRSDNGGEHVNEKFKWYFRNEGMLNQHSVARNPQQNGVSERANRTLLEKVRALLKGAGLHHKFWPLALHTAVFLKNISPTKAVKNMVPYEAWTGSRPDVSILRVFGCLAQARIEPTKKLTDRTRDYIFVGYDEERKAYKLMDKITNAVSSHRYKDVTFHETIFPALGNIQASPVQIPVVTTTAVIPGAMTPAVIPETPVSAVIPGAMTPAVIPETPVSAVTPGAKTPAVIPGAKTPAVIPGAKTPAVIPGVNTPAVIPETPVSAVTPEAVTSVVIPGSKNPAVMTADLMANISSDSDSESDSDAEETTQKKGDHLWGYYSDTSMSGVFHDNDSSDWSEASNSEPATDRVSENAMQVTSKRCPVTPKHFEGFVLYGFGGAKDKDIHPDSPRRSAWLASKAMSSVPLSYNEAINSPESHLWEMAIREELESFKANKVWTLQPLPEGVPLVGNKWVFKRKINLDGSVLHRARLVAKGYTQQYGVDYFDTFAPVVRKESLRILFSTAVNFNLKIAHLDVKTAFLHGELSEEVYVAQPDAPTDLTVPESTHLVCRLRKAVYGLKQAARSWYLKADHLLRKEGYSNTEQEPCIYTKTSGIAVTIVALYVDDFYLFYKEERVKIELIEALRRFIVLKDLGEARSCLGMRIERDWAKGTLKLHQEEYTNSILKEFGMENCEGRPVPLEHKMKLWDFEMGYEGDFKYQKLIGSLLYLSTNTRPDISYAVSFLSQFNSCYTSTHWDLAKAVLSYLKLKPHFGLNYSKCAKPSFSLVGYSDADWAGNPTDYKSYTGFCFTLDGNLVSWESRKQRCTAQSTAESESIALAEATKQSLYLGQLVDSLFDCGVQMVTLFCDNQSAITLATSENYFKARSKHYGCRIQLARDCLKEGLIELIYVGSKSNHADIFTKALERTDHEQGCRSLNLDIA